MRKKICLTSEIRRLSKTNGIRNKIKSSEISKTNERSKIIKSSKTKDVGKIIKSSAISKTNDIN